MSKQTIDQQLEKALTQSDLAMRQAKSECATFLLQEFGKMIVKASKSIGVDAKVALVAENRIYDPENGLWPQKMLLSFDEPIEEADEEELRTIYLRADKTQTTFHVMWHRADGKIGEFDGGPIATLSFLTDVDIPWTDED